MYSVWIPVRNEENNIEDVVNWVLGQTILPEEILVCVNDSKDKTKEIVCKLCEQSNLVKLLESNPWKANAWNKIVQNSKNWKMVFCDWDISLWTKNSLEILLNELDNQDMTMTWASIIQLPSKKSIPYKLRVPSGQLYAINLDKLDINSIPNNLINEDLFLALKSMPSVWVTDKTFFYCNKPSLIDIFHTQIRIWKWIKQILDLGFEEKLIELVSPSFSKTEIFWIIKMAKMLNVDKKDHLWKIPFSTKDRVSWGL